MAHRVMREFRMDEISGVDRPAQKGAKATIMKRDAAVAGSLVIAVGREAPDALPAFLALAKDIDGVIAKSAGALDAPIAALAGAVAKALEGAESARTPLLHKIFGEFRSRNQLLLAAKNGADDMPMKDIAKSLGLAETATEAEIAAAVTKNAKDAKDAADAKTAIEKQLAVAKLSPAESDYCAGMSDDDKQAFAGLKPDERAAKMATKKVEKSEAEKRFEKIEAENAALKVRVAKADDERARDVVVKRAGSELKFIGKADDVGGMLHDIAKVDPKLGKAVEDTLSGLNARLEKSGLFSEIGRGAGSSKGFAKDEISTKAQEIVTKSGGKVSIEEARDQVRRANPDLEKREDEESRHAA